MSGYRRANIDLINELFTNDTHIRFKKVSHIEIENLAVCLKKLNKYVEEYYVDDELLQMETRDFIYICMRIFGIVDKYSVFLKENDEEIRRYFTFTKKKKYGELFQDVIQPIITVILKLRNSEENAYLKKIQSLCCEQKLDSKKTVIIIKDKMGDSEIFVGDFFIRVMSENDFLNKGMYVDTLIFVGTPNYFNEKFKKIFYAKKIIFLAYSSFENKLHRINSFKNIIPVEQRINTIYEKVKIDFGTKGITIEDNVQIRDLDLISAKYETKMKEEGIETKLALISNSNYIFLPIKQKVNVINRDSLKVKVIKGEEINIDDLLVFRTQNAITFVREIADEILGDSALQHRKNVAKWKVKLYELVKKNTVNKVSRVFRKKYNLTSASINNIRYWISSFSIGPRCLEELLIVMNFNETERREILNSTKIIRSAHISSGVKISNILKSEMDESIENIIEENGFYTFESEIFRGTTFNIEEIKKISQKNYFVSEKNVLKIIKNGGKI